MMEFIAPPLLMAIGVILIFIGVRSNPVAKRNKVIAITIGVLLVLGVSFWIFTEYLKYNSGRYIDSN